MGLFAIGSRALGFSSGFAANVGNDEPGPQRMRACSPGDAEETACGIATVSVDQHRTLNLNILSSRRLVFDTESLLVRVEIEA